jgi:NADP-dependent 3-hydroxy acid dehydrogenase YdfG
MRKVLITGASTGIGLACAQYLADQNIHVYAGVRKETDFERVAKLHNNIQPIKIDIANEESIQNCYQTIQSEVQPDDTFALLNNAGIVRAGPLEFIPIEELKFQLDINITYHVRVSQVFMPLLRKVKDGRLLFTGSQSGFFTTPMMGPYCASKHGIEAIADAFRQELALNSKIKVILIQPGQIKTPIWDKSLDKAHEIQNNYPQDANNLYGQIIPKVEERAKDAGINGAHTDVVSKDVYTAITSSNPKTRYRQGKGANLSYFLKLLLSDKTRDRLIRFVLKV